MRIVCILSKLLKTVGLFAVRLNLAELRWKNRKKISHFYQKSELCIFDKNLNPFFLKRAAQNSRSFSCTPSGEKNMHSLTNQPFPVFQIAKNSPPQVG